MKFNIIYTLITITSCTLVPISSEVNLGSGYFYVPDGKYSCIIITDDENYRGIGTEVIPPYVVSYAYNKRCILVVSLVNNVEYYWFINKSIKGIDSAAFYSEIDSENLELHIPQ